MAITKKEKKNLENILYDLERVKSYILKDKVIFVIKSSLGAMPEDTYFNKKDGHTITSGNKHIGTELCYLYNAVDKLTWFLKPKINELS
jgi:hypothetical protein